MFYLARPPASGSARGGRRAARSRPVWPVWLLAAATVFLVGFRIGLNVRGVERDRRRLLGRHRRRPDRRAASRRTGTCRSRTTCKPCGPADSSGEIRERIQTNGRCESANERGDTYGPVAYEAYLPGYLALRLDREVGQPARRALRRRSSGTCSACSGLRSSACASAASRLAATLAFAWAAYPFTRTCSTRTRTTRSCPRS